MNDKAEHEVMEMIRDVRPCINPELEGAMNKEQWRDFFWYHWAVPAYFDGLSQEDAQLWAFEKCVSEWTKVQSLIYDAPAPVICAGCQQIISRAGAPLADGATVHYGYEWGLDCFNLYRQIRNRERHEAISALKTIGLDAVGSRD